MIEETNVMKRSEVEPQKTRIFENSLSEYGNAWTALCSHSLSPLSPLFSFLLHTSSICSNCSHITSTYQEVTSLSLPLPLHNVMIISVILYPPFLLTETCLVTPPPQQYSLQVRKGICFGEFQELLSSIDRLHLPPSFYIIQTSSNDVNKTQDWVNGMMCEGKNLICRIIPPYQSNLLNVEWFQNHQTQCFSEDSNG